jgi:bifunctional DNA-binding transcriptional regulator/antitoxin component of YhaV-PrlF toxin-antitoxin module
MADFPPFRYNVSCEVRQMGTVQFKLPIGAKRQVTIPSKAMELLSLRQGDDLLLEIVGDRAVLLPSVSVARHELPKELREQFLARRAAKDSFIPLDQFFEEVDMERAKAKRQAVKEHASSGNSRKKSQRIAAAIKTEPAAAKA